MLISSDRLLAGVLFAALCAPGALAQQGSSQPQQPEQSPQTNPNQNQNPDQSSAPIPAYHSPLAGGAAQDQNSDQGTEMSPDTTSPAGGVGLTLGSPETSRSYWQPSVSLVQTLDYNAYGESGWYGYTSVLGGVNVHKISGDSDLTIGYLGGGSFSDNGKFGNTVIQDMNFAEKIKARRFVVTLVDTLQYLPQSAFGYGGIGGIGIGGVGVPSGGALALAPGLSPEGTILTNFNQQLDNSSVGEVDINLTPRTSMSVLGGYSLMRFFNNQLLDFNDWFAQGGFNHQFTRDDTFSAFYRHSEFSYSALRQKIRDNVVQLEYTRRLTGRLAFQIGAGPEYTLFETPILTGAGGSTSSTETTWSLATSLTYQVKRGTLGASYFHGVNGGSGVLSGAIGDTANGYISRQLTRTTNFGLNAGYARNRALSIPGFAIFNENFNYGFIGANLNRPFGRSITAFVSYQAQIQNASVGYCIGTSCGGTFLGHFISVGFTWQTRPLLF